MIDAAIYLVGVAAGAYLGVLADRRLRRRRAIRRLRADLASPAQGPEGKADAGTRGRGDAGMTLTPPGVTIPEVIATSPAVIATWAHRGVMCTEKHCMN